MIVGIVIDELLERSYTVGTIVTERGEWDHVKAKFFTDDVRSDFTKSERILWEIPKWLFATTRFVDSRIGCAFVMNVHEECVIRAENELPFKFILTTLQGNP